MSKIDGNRPEFLTPLSKAPVSPAAESVSTEPLTLPEQSLAAEIETRSSFELEAPVKPAPQADQPLGGLTLPLLLQQLQMSIVAIEKSGSTADMEALYERSEPIVQALRQSMATPPAPARPETAEKPRPTLAERNQGQIRRFELLYKHLDMAQFSSLLGFKGEISKAVQAIFLRLGRDIHSWSDLTHALDSSGVTGQDYRGLAAYQAQVVINAQPFGSTLFIASQPQDQKPVGLAQEKEILQQHFEHESFFALEDPSPLEIEGFIQSGRFSQVWVSGHGVPSGVILSDSDGKTELLPHARFVEMLKGHPAVKEVVTNICSGGLGGDHSLIAQLQQAGLRATGYEAPVLDSVAINLASAVHKHIQAGKGIAQAVEDSFHEVYPKRQAFLETDTTAYGLPRYLVAASAKEQSDCIGNDVAEMVVRALQNNNPTALKRYLVEYPGLVNVFAWVTAQHQNNAALTRELSIDYPELLLVQKDVEKRLNADPSLNLLQEAIASSISWQYLGSGKSFLEVARPTQTAPQP